MLETKDAAAVAQIQLQPTNKQHLLLDQKFKYHLNHLRPPSLVPITIQQATNSNYNFAQTATTTTSNGNNGQQQQHSWPSQSISSASPTTIAGNGDGSTNLRPQLMANPNDSNNNNHNNGTQTAKGPTTSMSLQQLRGRHQRASGQGAGESERLVQLQLPLQLHLKLRPLPLPMPPPPPSGNRRSSSFHSSNEELRSGSGQETTNSGQDVDDSFASGEKRKRSLEFDSATTTTTAASSSPPVVANKTLVKARDNNESSLERNDLLMFAWREAKRVLLLNSMSPALIQAGKLERRSADLRGAESSVESSSSSSSSNGIIMNGRAGPEVPSPAAKQNVQDDNLKNFATTTTLQEESIGPGNYQNLLIEQNNNNDKSTTRLIEQSIPPTTTTTTSTTVVLGVNINNDNNENSLTRDKEVRRQRHSSQQQLQGEQNIPTTTTLQPDPVNDARMQAMAAAMLPLVWPSFQLTGNTNQQQQQQQQQRLEPWQQSSQSSSIVSSGRLQTTSAWPMKYMQLSRPDRQQQVEATTKSGINPNNGTSPMAAATSATTNAMQAAETSQSPTTQAPAALRQTLSSASASATTTLTNGDSDALDSLEPKVRAKRRKPSYLSQTMASSTPYPDSTRLASKYPMPKIKFRGVEQAATNAADIVETTRTTDPGAIMLSKRPIAVPEPDVPISSRQRKAQQSREKSLMLKQISNLPKSLSKLIEQQLLVNGTSLLQYHKSQIGGLPPTTSTSKVVRLIKANATIAEVRQKVPTERSRQTTKRNPKDPVASMRRHSSSRVQMHTLAPPEMGSSSSTTASPNLIAVQPPPPQVITTPSISIVATSLPTTTTTNRPPASGTTRRPRATLAPTTTTTTSTSTTTTTTTTSAPTTTTTTTQTPTSTKATATMSATLPVVSANDENNKPTTRRQRQMGGRKRQRVRDQVLEENEPETAGSNKILPEEEEQPQQPISVLSSRSSNWTRPKTGRKLAGSNGGGKNSGIKLFHFKRKPDMNKLPFYKRPLNYTELGWTPEQIQEHQEAWRRAAEAAGSGGGDQSDENVAGSVAAVILNDGADGRQRRKRRGKNHFERLMGELHNGSGSSAAETAGEANGTDEAEDGDEDTTAKLSNLKDESETTNTGNGQQDSSIQASIRPVGTSGGEERVPVMKKKSEPLLVRPMFSIINQKRRLSATSSGSESTSSSAQQQQQAPSVNHHQSEEVPQLANGQSDFSVSDSLINNNNVSKPVVRMRRKHHGEQPVVVGGGNLNMNTMMMIDEPWRPSRPLVWGGQANSERLMFVPSGILTPSGSQLVPMLSGNNRPAESNEDRSRLAMELLAWRPARQHQQQQQNEQVAASSQWRPTTSMDNYSKKPSDGLAPSGEESFLRAPGDYMASSQIVAVEGGQQAVAPETSPLTAATSMDNQNQKQSMSLNMSPIIQHQQQSAGNGSGTELKVPRLLVKPMRPAKYSLNGYIPKPSLGQQQQLLQQQVRAPPGKPPKWPPGGNRNTANSNQQQQQGLILGPNGKDLDSSTSNEVFSRRRGLQQHRRSSQPKSQLSFNSLLMATTTTKTGTTTATDSATNRQQRPLAAAGQNLSDQTSELSAHLRQLEENKRKYLVNQPAKSPTLSAQKANLIKAKLGLIVTQMASNSSSSKSATSSLVGDELTSADGGQSSLKSNSNSKSTAAEASAYLPLASSPNAIVTFKAKQVGSSGGQIPNDQIPMAGAAQTSAIPKTDFECTDSKGRFVAGLFADYKTGCQVWHLCSNNRKYSFLCPAGTIFSAKLRICDWKYNVKCENSLPH